ncbi:MAG: CAP domain-containing protein [Dehalococcoidia bacterium]|nr:CAP domain-containing protein [Dehalococcoidia bacterium]
MHIRTHRGVLPLALIIVGALLASFAMTFADDNRAGALTNCEVSHDGNDSEELAFLSLINNYRTQNGLGTLTISTNLNRGSAWMTEDLATNNYFAHTDSLGRSAYQRAIDCGYPSGAGENLAAGGAWSSAQAAFNAWQNSPGHNANMLGQYYKQIGIARFYLAGSQYGWYWATTFGTTDDGSGGGGAGDGGSGGTEPTNTPFPPTSTPLPTNTPTPIQPTATPTSVPPTSTPTSDSGGGQATATPTPFVPTATPTPRPSGASPATTPPPATPTPTKTPATVPANTPAPAPTLTPTPTAAAGAPSLPLSPGANLVAWPGDNVSPAQAFSGNTSIKVVYEWNAATGEWHRYFPGLPAYLNNLARLNKGGAYWVIANQASQLRVDD